jgi:hypothetical protein
MGDMFEETIKTDALIPKLTQEKSNQVKKKLENRHHTQKKGFSPWTE